MSYIIKTTSSFERSYRKLVSGNKKLEDSIENIFMIMLKNPFLYKLRTHKVSAVGFKQLMFSSRVNSDLRIIWEFLDDNSIILISAIGGHSGSDKVYK